MAAFKEAVGLVKNKREFEAGDVFAVDYPATGYYVVFSYGLHWPLFIYDHKNGQWYGNIDKRSKTTNKHYSRLNPENVLPLSWAETRRLVSAARMQK